MYNIRCRRYQRWQKTDRHNEEYGNVSPAVFIPILEELAKMMATKPDMIQGYYFGKPTPAEYFEEEFLQSTGSL